MEDWINTKDKKPEYAKEVLIFNIETGTYHLAIIYEEWGTWDTDDDQCFSYKDITHWMPLPKKPTN